jgi:hypothetical protein
MRMLRQLFAALALIGSCCAATQAATLPQPALMVTPRAASAASAPTSYFYSTYQRSGANILWVTCGHDATSGGCYGSGELGPFGRPCVVAAHGQRVLVADADPTNTQQTLLYVYARTESATPTATLKKTLTLQIPASSTAVCHLAVGGSFAYFGTSESPTFYKIDLGNYATTPGSSCGANTSAITVSAKAVAVSQTNCFTLFDLSGAMQEDGGQFTDTFVPGAEGFGL